MLDGDGGTEEAEGTHLGDQLGRVLVRVLEVGREGQHVLHDEGAHGGDELGRQLGIDRHQSGCYGRQRARCRLSEMPSL